MKDNNTIIKPVESMNNIGNIKRINREPKRNRNLNHKKENEPAEDTLNEQDTDQNPNDNDNNKNGEHSIDFCA